MTHDTPLAVHLCSLQIRGLQATGWCLWCGKDKQKRGDDSLFCDEHCRISYLEDVNSTPVNTVERVLRIAKRRKAKSKRIPVKA